MEQELLKRSLDSLDYSGNWSDPARMRDSMVLSCKSPEVRHATLMEYGAAHAKAAHRVRVSIRVRLRVRVGVGVSARVSG